MPTQAEELQAKEFLKRAEIRTMRKDLRALREADALKERDKIAKIKTLEEQLEEKRKATLAEQQAQLEKEQMERVLTKNAGEERIAEKDLKNYATEPERQQIFLLESQRLAFEKQIDVIDKEKDPALKLEKNKILLLKRNLQEKLNSILQEEKKLENEQKFTIEKEQTTTIPSQRKSLEQSRWDLDKKIQEVEKRRWEAEKQIQEIDAKTEQINKSSDLLITDKNVLRDKILGVDKSLRDIYSVVMAREEEKRRGMAQEQMTKREATERARLLENEKIQRQQWSGISIKKQSKDDGYLSNAPKYVKDKLVKTSIIEEDQRKKFIQDVESWSEGKDKNIPKAQKKIEVVITPPTKIKTETPIPQQAPQLPPVPRRKV